MSYKSRFSNFFFVIGRRLSRDDFAKFVKFLLDALKADTSGSFAAFIAQLEPKYVAFLATLVARKSGTGEAMTQTYAEVVKECLQFVKDTMRKKVVPEHDVTSSKYKEFLPNGLNEYNKADQATFVVIFKRFKDACIANEALVTVPVKDAAIALNTKLDEKGSDKNKVNKLKQDHIASLDEDEEEIAVMLFMIFGFLIYTYSDKPDRAYDFFDFSVIKTTQADDEADEADLPNPNPAP